MNDFIQKDSKEGRILDEMLKKGLINQKQLENALSDTQSIMQKAKLLKKSDIDELIRGIDDKTMSQINELLKNIN